MLFLAATAKKHKKRHPPVTLVSGIPLRYKNRSLSGRHLPTELFGGRTTVIRTAPRDAAFSSYIKGA
ncbi:hypothetical protein HMPREF3213_01417 [Heyndrickxia coagulans]|uniref:Uncharacterized protein n=1 Tax=Heyndrickxia coagulans TaxID=1398 RepID=A0A133KTN3_HEYCO|nr:hypothetical protein HMPREF3213_01417 [Heyndrickxia coagulans]